MFKDLQGQPVPNVTFNIRRDAKWETLTSDSLFRGKTVIVFALPGAFTPTCSSSHVPGYNDFADTFKQQGIDDILCISVNDAFVMAAWQAEQHADKLRFIPDGNAEFTAAMGMLVDKNETGFGKRSWRYSMLVRDGIIEKMFIEPEQPGDPFEVSDADTMLAYINPAAEKPLDIVLLTRKECGYCAHAKQSLQSAGLKFEELLLHRDFSHRALHALSGDRHFPQVFINGEHIGGAEQLDAWLKRRHKS